MSWFYLVLAILTEVSGTICMKLSQGLSKLLPSVFIFIFYGLSLCGLTLALKKLDISTAYAIWAGLGTALITVVGVTWFKEPVTILKLVCLGLIVAGVVGLNLGGGVRH